MHRFPLLKLPSLVLEIVLKSLNIEDVIDLSMMSSRFKRILESHKIPIYQFHVYHNVGYTGVCLGVESNPHWPIEARPFMDIISYYPANPYEVENGWKIRRINGEDVMCQQTKYGSCTFFERHLKARNKTNEAKDELLEQICTHLLSFMNVQNFRVSCRREMDFSNMFIWKFTRNLERLEVSPLDGLKIQVTPNDLKFILEEVKSQQLFLNIQCPNVKYTPPLDHKEIEIYYPSWLDFKNISIDPETTHMQFKMNDEVSESDINRLIKQWMEGKCEKLKFLAFSESTYGGGGGKRTEHFEKLQMEKILDGLDKVDTDYTPRQFEQRGMILHWKHRSCQVVKCKNPEILGAVIKWNYSCIGLHTWNEVEVRNQEEREQINN